MHLSLVLSTFFAASFIGTAWGYDQIVWRDKSGFNFSNGCVEGNIKSSELPFSIVFSEKYERVRMKASNAGFRYEVHSGTIVRNLESHHKKKLIEVISYQGKQDPYNDLLALSKTRGLISRDFLLPLVYIKLQLAANPERELSRLIGNSDYYLVVSSGENGVRTLDCEEEGDEGKFSYILFDVLDNKGSKLAEVGVSKEEYAILKFGHANSKAFDRLYETEEDLYPHLNPLSYTVCMEEGYAPILSSDHTEVVFKAIKGEEIIPYQTFDGSELKEILEDNGAKKIYRKVKFPLRKSGENIGWILRDFISLAGKCPFIELTREISDVDEEKKKIFTFPTVQKPTHPYDSGMRRFGARRGGGTRLHAANDIYRKINDAVVAVQGGHVIRPLYYFYQDTFAIEVKHDSGMVVRYGEITSKTPSGSDLSVGARVETKELVGFIGKVNSNCCKPMLHFELYSGKGSGRLSQRDAGNKYKRRWDLLNPTKYLKKWELDSPWK